MVAVSFASSAIQSSVQQLVLQQAKRTADQAEQTAQSLKAQANDAQRVADSAQQDARSLSIQSDQAQAKAGLIRQGIAGLSAETQGINLPSKFVVQESSSLPTPVKNTGAAIVSAPTPPVVNSQGQVTGTIITTTA